MIPRVAGQRSLGKWYGVPGIPGIPLGGGVVYYFHPQWALTGGLLYRFNWFTSAEGKNLDPSLYEGALALTVGIAYTF